MMYRATAVLLLLGLGNAHLALGDGGTSASADTSNTSNPAVSADGAVGGPGGAGNAIPSGSQSDTDLHEIVVTATRTAQPLDKTGSSLSVLSAADLQTQQQLVVSDALAELPGVSVARTGGPGQDTNLYIRGAAPGETLVLIDGIRINDPTTVDDEAVLGDLFVNDIDRIEVLRGPQSTLYGSDAIGGVVNILTDRGGSSALAGDLQAEGGSYGTWRVNGAAHGSAGPLEYGAGVNDYATRGVEAAASSSPDLDPDGDRNLSATANLRVHAGESFSVDLRGFDVDTRVGIPGYPPPLYALQASPEFDKDHLLAGYAGLNGSFFEGQLTQRLALVTSDSDRLSIGQYDPVSYAYFPAENFYAQGGATRWEYQGVFTPSAANQVTFGAETQLSTLTTDSLPDPLNEPTTGRDRLTSTYAQWQTTLAQRLTLTGGARQDQDQLFGSHSSGRIAAAWQLPDGATVLRGNFGNAFKAPTLYELFSAYSNPFTSLHPESAVGWEAGVDHTLLDQRARLSATYFQRDEHDEIDFDDCFTSDPGCVTRPYGYYFNVGRSSYRGVEAELALRPLQSLSAWLNYTNLTAIDEATGLQLGRRPHVAGNAGLTWTPRTDATLGASYGYTGARYDDDANTLPLPSAALVNLFASYPLSASLQALARVDNLFNNQSEPLYGYRPLGRGVYAGLRLKL